MKKIASIIAICTVASVTLQAQTFFSLNAGTDGVNFNVTNVPPLFPVVHVAPPPPRHVYAPLMPGVSYDDYGYYHSKKAYKKAAKRYKKAMKHAAEALPMLMLTAPGVVYYDDDFDYDDYEDYYRHVRKHYKKLKHHKEKHHKHHKHHHDDDDD